MFKGYSHWNRIATSVLLRGLRDTVEILVELQLIDDILG